MKILHCVEFYSPSIGGAQEVVRQLSEHMVMMGHSVTVATTKLPERQSTNINGVQIKEFGVNGNLVKGISGDLESYREFVLNSKFDAIMVYAAQQWTFDALIPILDKIKAKKIFVPCGFSGLNKNAYTDYFKQMPTWLMLFDTTVYLSEFYQDYDFARSNNINNLSLIPNGADEREFRDPKILNIKAKLGIPSNNKLFLTIGTHTNLKGHKEAIQVFNKLNIKNSTLVIVGNGSNSSGCFSYCHNMDVYTKFNPIYKFRNRRILSPKLSRQETVSLLFEADMFWFFSNIECSPLVLFECMAAGLPFVTADVGNATEIATWSKNGAIVESSKSREGLSQVNIKIAVDLIRKRMATGKELKLARKTWSSQFTWDKISKEYLLLYETK